MKIGGDPPHLPRGGIVFHPDDLVIARVIVAGKAKVVLPEQVVADHRAVGVEDGDDVLEREELAPHHRQAGREAKHQGALFGGRFRRRVEREQLGVMPARLIERTLPVRRQCLLVQSRGIGSPGGRTGQGQQRRQDEAPAPA